MNNGNVKSFDDSTGHGWISVDDGEDVYVHYSSIQGAGFKTLVPGEVVTFELVRGPKGPHAANVRRNI